MEMRGEQVKKSCVEEQLKSILFGARLHNLFAMAFMVVLGLFFGIVSELMIALEILSKLEASLLVISGLGIILTLEIEFNRLLTRALSLVPHHVDVQEQGEASQGGESDEERS